MRILKKSLNITFINPNTEEQIVQAMAGVLAYNLAENDDNIKFDYNNSNTYQNSHEEIEDELEGPFTDLGEAIICKKSTGESIHVFIEDYGMSKKKAFEMVMR